MNRKRVPLLFSVVLFLVCCLSVHAQPVAMKKLRVIDGEVSEKPEIKILTSTENRLEISFKIPMIEQLELVVHQKKFHKLYLEGFSESAEPGTPSLPVSGKFIQIPGNAHMNIEIQDAKFKEFDEVNLLPVTEPQPETSDSAQTQLNFSEQIYQNDAFYPPKLAWVEPVKIIRKNLFTILWVTPVQFNPVKHKVRVFSEFTVTVRFNGDQTNQEKLKYWSPYFENMFGRLVVNHESFSRPSNLFKQIKYETSETDGYDFLIIAHSDLKEAADSLALWRNLTGLKTKVVLVDEIGQDSESIKRFIQEAYDYGYPAPTFVLFLGDAEYVPTNYVTEHPDESGKIGTDLYYATVDGDDYFPDLITGRIPVDTPEDAMLVVNKIIKYEKEPVTDPDFYQKASALAYFQDDDEEDTQDYNERDGFEDRRFVLTSEEIRDYLQSIGYTVDRIYNARTAVTPTHYNNRSYANGEPLPAELLKANGFRWDGDYNDINRAIMQGRFLISHRDHGSRSGWGDPSYKISQVRTLRNGEKLPVVFSINCATGWYDNETDDPAANTGNTSECFVEYWLRNPNGGSAAIFGSTRISYSGYNDALTKGIFDALWPDFLGYRGIVDENQNLQLGPALAHGKLYMATQYNSTKTRKIEFEEFHFYGDPAFSIRTQFPLNMVVDLPDSLFFNQKEIIVNTEEANVRVSISQEGKLLATAMSDETGLAHLNFSPIVSDSPVDISAVKQNRIPFLTKVPVFSPQGVCIINELVSLQDENNNDEINIGEHINLTIDLKNVGSQSANDITIQLLCTDPYISLLDSSSFISVLNKNDHYRLENLSFSVKNNCPPNRRLNLILTVSSDAGYYFEFPLEYVVKEGKPLLAAVSSMVATSVSTLHDSAEAKISFSNDGFGILNYQIRDLQKNTISIAGGQKKQWANSPNGAGNVYLSNENTSIFQFCVNLNISTPITLHFFIYEGNALLGNYKKVGESTTQVSQLGDLIVWSDTLNVPVKQGRYYYLGISWAGGTAFICRAASMPPINLPIGKLATGCVNAGGNPPADSIDQTYRKIVAFAQEIRLGSWSWLKFDSISDQLLSSEHVNLPLKFYATHPDTTFQTTLLLTSSDPDHDSLTIPIYFMVDNAAVNLIWESSGISDKQGNKNGVINFAEKINVPITIKNIGFGQAEQVVLELSSSDSNMTIVKDKMVIEKISAGEELFVEAFEFEMSPYCSTGHETSFDITISANNYAGSHKLFTRGVYEGNPIIALKTDSLKMSTQNVNDTVYAEIELSNQGFGSLIYKIDNPTQKNYSIGTILPNKWIPLQAGCGNVYFQKETARLLKVASYFDISAPASIYFFVYEGSEKNGLFYLLHKNKIEINHPMKGWLLSEPLKINLLAGKYYYIGTSWQGDAKISQAMEKATLSTDINDVITCSLNSGGFPPADSLQQKTNSTVLLTQKLITGDGLWLDLPTEADTLFAKETNKIPVTLVATHPDTSFFAEVFLHCNDVENDPLKIPVHFSIRHVSTAIKIDEPILPEQVVLYPNYPNPFSIRDAKFNHGRQSTEIKYVLPQTSEVTLTVYNLLGQKVKTLVSQKQKAGIYFIKWNGRNDAQKVVPSSVYFIVLQAGNNIKKQKLLLLN